MKFKVKTYALLDVLESLANYDEQGSYLDVVVSKEDGQLVVYVEKHSVRGNFENAPSVSPQIYENTNIGGYTHG